MKILMTNNALDFRAGSESYLETVACELRRLGHEVSLFSPLCGPMATLLRTAGFAVFETVEDLPRDFDVIHGQHANAVGMVRGRLPRVPLVFATHSWLIAPLEDPVAELGASAFVAFNELTRRRLEAHAATAGAEVVRLTQPVDISFADGARVPLAPAPRRAVAISRRMALLPERLAKACLDLGIEFEWVGGLGSESADARQEMLTADIVVAMGRTALEAMAAGRAVLVLDDSTSGGWVSDSSYADLEADGFTGLETNGGGGPLADLLNQYAQELGMSARRLAVQHHAVQHHAARLVEIYTSVADTRAEATSPHTLTLLAADRFAFEQRAVTAEWQAAQHRHELDAVRRDLESAQWDVEQLRVERDALRESWQRMSGRRDRVRQQRDRAQKQHDKVRRQRDVLRKRLERTRAQRDEARAELSSTRARPLVRAALWLSQVGRRRGPERRQAGSSGGSQA